MNPDRYDAPVKNLIKEYLEQQRTQQASAWKTLAALKKEASALGDYALSGFVSYQYAYSHYYSGGDHKKVRRYLKDAVHYLLRSDDHEMLAKTYNFIAIEAHDSGVYDIAYNYYLTSMYYDEKRDSSGNTALVEINLGRLFSQLGNPALARIHTRRSIRYMKQSKDKLLHLRNMIVLYLNDAFISLALEDLPAAKRALGQSVKFVEKSDPQEVSDILLPLLFLRIRIALLEKNAQEARKLLRQAIERLRNTPRLYEYVDDIFDFCEALMQAKRYVPLGEILSIIDPTIMEHGTPRLKLRFSELKVRFFTLCKDDTKRKEALFEQHRLYEEQKKSQAQVLDYYTELVGMVATIHDEQEAISREHLLLQLEAQTDSLTGMPNRHAMIRHLERAFEKAYHGKKLLGVEILDIDAFKQYNDTYGHQAGDVCLSRLSWSLMRLSAHPKIFCARYGGDEFVIVYEDMTDEEILAHATRLRQEVEAQRIPHAKSHISRFITISQGICNGIPKNKNRLWDFLSEADLALYSIKKNDLPSSRGNAVKLNPQPAQGKGGPRFTSPAFSSALSSGSSSKSSAARKKKASAKRSR